MPRPEKTKPNTKAAQQLRRYLIQYLQQNQWRASMDDIIDYIEMRDYILRQAWSHVSYKDKREKIGDIIRSTKDCVNLIFRNYRGKDGKARKRVILHDPKEDKYFHIQGLFLHFPDELEEHFQHILKLNLKSKQNGLAETIDWINTFSEYTSLGLEVNEPEVGQPSLFAA